MRHSTLSQLLAALIAFQLPLSAQGKGGAGDLMVMPTRVILEGRERAAEVALRNAGKEKTTYRIFFREMDMQTSGKVEEKTKAEGELCASDLVRYSPKQVDLAPGETQTVRIQLRKPEGLKDGEYRSHLVFQGVPPAQPPRPAEPTEEQTLSFDIKAIFGISIPIIIRHGDCHATVALSNLKLTPPATQEAPPALELRLERSGNRSVMGEFKVEWLPANGRPVVVLPLAGSVIYHNLAFREVSLELPGAKGHSLKAGRLKVTYAPKDIKQPPVVAFLDLP